MRKKLLTINFMVSVWTSVGAAPWFEFIWSPSLAFDERLATLQHTPSTLDRCPQVLRSAPVNE